VLRLNILFIRIVAIATVTNAAALTPPIALPQLFFGTERLNELPETGVPMLSHNALFEVTLRNPQSLPASSEIVEIEGQPFERALRVRTGKPTEEWWAIQLLLPTVAPVYGGDTLLTTFYIRGVETNDETGEAYFRIFLQTDGPPWDKSVVTRWGAGRKWRKIVSPLTAVRSRGPGKAVFTLAFGSGPQVIEIGGLTLTNYGQDVPIEKLPMSKSAYEYEGSKHDAPWRAEAQQRIERIRKGALVVYVKNSAGQPVPGTEVSVEMTRHAFPFGTAAAVENDKGVRFGRAYGNTYWFTPEDDEKYDFWLKHLFNKVTPRTSLMTNAWTGHWPYLGRQAALNNVKRYRDMGFPIRGHILVWPSWQYFYLPGIEEVKTKPEVLGPMVLEHIADETGTLKETVFEWTVLNEPFTHHDLIDVLGREAMVGWFTAARKANPKAKLYINDFGILSGGGLDYGHQDHYSETIQFLLNRGAPVDGIGLQGHFGEDVTPPQRVYELLNRYAAYGKDLMITEFDINSLDTNLQANYTRDFLTICFSHPAVCGFDLWGFWERDHWRPDAALIDKDWNIKPNGQAFQKLVRSDWWTEQKGVTGKDGKYTVRGFIGDYRITVRRGTKTREYNVKLPSEGTELEVLW
jgi:GH35 family endo-1,4-beta-xylanase